MITVEDVSKHKGRRLVLDRVNLHATPGRVTAFLGTNGAGKTSTLRVLLGIDRADSGVAHIAGQEYRDLAWPLRQVGAMLDGSGAHPSRTARAHLRWVARSNRIALSRVEEVLGEVGLDDVGRKRIRQYSLGMGRRLGIATALLGEPDVLIFDEPTNGLDPEGIRWLRGLLRDHAEKGGTVLLSSHLMAEVEAIADDVTVISAGTTIASGTLDSVRGHHQHLEDAFFALTQTAGPVGGPR